MGVKVLVTGAAGFIGSHLTEALVREGFAVRAFVRYNSRNDWGMLQRLQPEVLSQVEVVTGDLKDPEAVRTAVGGVEVVYHLGALIAIPYSYLNPTDVVQTNVLGTTHVLNACLKSDSVRKVVHTSTSETYGTARYVPIDEKHPMQPQSPYSASKIGADAMAMSYHLSFGLPVATLRPFNTYGPRQSARAFIPTMITQALTQDVIKVGNLSPRRDLTYVQDTVRGFIACAQSPHTAGQAVNLGTGTDQSMDEVLQKILALVGRDVRVEADPQRVRPDGSEVERLLSDYSRARELMGWEPSFSLDEGLRLTVAWIRAHLDDYKVGIYNV